MRGDDAATFARNKKVIAVLRPRATGVARLCLAHHGLSPEDVEWTLKMAEFLHPPPMANPSRIYHASYREFPARRRDDMGLLDEAEVFWADHLFAFWDSGAGTHSPLKIGLWATAYGRASEAASSPSRRLRVGFMDWMRAWQAQKADIAALRDVDRAWARADQSIASSPVSESGEPARSAETSSCRSIAVPAIAARLH
jgi:hypothetical protein